MNKVGFPLVLIVFLCLLFLNPFFKVPFYISHDGEAHVARFAAYYKAYSDGQYPSRWAGDLNLGFGSPVFIFYYPLPGTIASLIHSTGFTFEDSFKIIMSLSFIGSPVFFYLWLVRKVRKEVAFIGAFLYGFAPYHFLDLYVRGDIAEMLALTFVALVFLFIDKTGKIPKITNILFGGLSFGLMVLSHNAISLMFTPVILLYIFLMIRKKRLLFYCLGIILIGFLLSAFFWIPALFEAKYTNAGLFIGNMFKDHFPSLTSLFYSPWGLGPDVNKPGGLSPQIGPVHVLLVILGAVVFYLKKKFDLQKTFWVSIFLIALLMTLSVTSIIWENLPLLKLFQFPWRFTALSSFTAAVIAALFFDRFYGKRLMFLTVLLLLIISVPSTTIKETKAKSDGFYNSYSGTTYYHGQASTIWTAGDPGKKAEQQIEIIDGEAMISKIEKKSNSHVFIVEAKTNSRVLDNTIYFPGWQVKVDGEKVPIEFQDINHRGLITFSVPQGQHNVEVRFGESPVRFISNMTSLVSIIVITGLVLLRKRFNKLLRSI